MTDIHEVFGKKLEKTSAETLEEKGSRETWRSAYWDGGEIGCSFLDCGLRLHTEELLAKEEECLTKSRKNIFVWKFANLIRREGLKTSRQFGKDLSKQGG